MLHLNLKPEKAVPLPAKLFQWSMPLNNLIQKA